MYNHLISKYLTLLLVSLLLLPKKLGAIGYFDSCSRSARRHIWTDGNRGKSMTTTFQNEAMLNRVHEKAHVPMKDGVPEKKRVWADGFCTGKDWQEMFTVSTGRVKAATTMEHMKSESV